MDSPYLESGEAIILTTDRVSIDSRQYDLLLTTKYLILIDIRYDQFLPQKIPLQTILSVKAGKIATGDPAITLYFSDTSRTGRSDQMNLIFSRQQGEQRDRERNEWLKKLMELVVAGRQEVISPRTVPASQEIGIRPAMRRQIAPEMQLPHSTVIDSRPAPIELAIIHEESEEPAFPEVPASGAGEAEISAEESPEAPASTDRKRSDVPEIITPGVSRDENIGLGIPEIAGTEEIPYDSGEHMSSLEMTSSVASEGVPSDEYREDLVGSVIPGTSTPEEAAAESVEATVPDRVPTEPEIIVPEVSPEESITRGTPTPEEAPAESVEATVPDRLPTEPEIIVPEASPEVPEESITRGTPTSKGMPADPQSGMLSIDRIPDESEIIVPEVSYEDSGGLLPAPDMITSEEPLADSGTESASPEPLVVAPPISGEGGTVQSDTGIAEAVQSGEPAGQPEGARTSPAPGSPPPPGSLGKPQKSSILAAAIIVLILGIAAIALFFPSSFGAPAREFFPNPTPSLTVTTESISSIPITPAKTPVIIPPTGVWVRVTYPQDYFGRLGNPGSLREVSGSGDRFYQMSADNPLVQVQMHKTDNSGDILSVDIYRNGKLMTHRTTSSPMGDIDLLIDSTTGAPPGIPPRITQTTGPVPTNNQARPLSNQTSAPVVNQTRPVPSPTVTPLVNMTTQITNQTNNQTGSRVMYF